MTTFCSGCGLPVDLRRDTVMLSDNDTVYHYWTCTKTIKGRTKGMIPAGVVSK